MEDKKYILATHVWSDGPSQALREYLIKNRCDFIWIGHPLFYSKKITGSGYSIFIKGREIKNKYFSPHKLVEPVKYIWEIWLNIVFVWKTKASQNYIYIGYNNLNAFSGIILKKLGKVSKIIYYVIDYTPKRFDNKLLNFLFHKIDQFCVKYADETWNLNEKAMNDARKKFYNFDAYQKGFSIQKEIPMGFWKKRIKLKSFEEINKKQIVFLGNISGPQGGVQFVLKALPEVIKKIPSTKLVVIGSGEYLDTLKKIAVELKIVSAVEFTGYIKELSDAEDILANSALAIAIYREGNYETNITYYTDSGKVKNYLGCGLPILLSDVPPIARDLEKNNCGLIINNNPYEISGKIIELLSSETRLKFYRKNVLNYRDQFDWGRIFRVI